MPLAVSQDSYSPKNQLIVSCFLRPTISWLPCFDAARYHFFVFAKHPITRAVFPLRWMCLSMWQSQSLLVGFLLFSLGVLEQGLISKTRDPRSCACTTATGAGFTPICSATRQTERRSGVSSAQFPSHKPFTASVSHGCWRCCPLLTRQADGQYEQLCQCRKRVMSSQDDLSGRPRLARSLDV